MPIRIYQCPWDDKHAAGHGAAQVAPTLAALPPHHRTIKLDRMFVPRSCADPRMQRARPSRAPTPVSCTILRPRSTSGASCAPEGRVHPARPRSRRERGSRIVDLSGVEMHGCRLTAATFVRVKLAGAQIHLSFLDRATFEECDSTGATFQNAVFAGSELVGLHLRGLRDRAGQFPRHPGRAHPLRSFQPLRLAVHRLAAGRGEHARLQPHARRSSMPPHRDGRRLQVLQHERGACSRSRRREVLLPFLPARASPTPTSSARMPAGTRC